MTLTSFAGPWQLDPLWASCTVLTTIFYPSEQIDRNQLIRLTSIERFEGLLLLVNDISTASQKWEEVLECGGLKIFLRPWKSYYFPVPTPLMIVVIFIALHQTE